MLKIYILGFLVTELKFRVFFKKIPNFCIEFKHDNGQQKNYAWLFLLSFLFVLNQIWLSRIADDHRFN
jgi:hypothetical protein